MFSFHIDLAITNRPDIGQVIGFQLLEPYEQLLQFPSQIFLTSLTILLTARLRLTQERIRNLTLEEENGLYILISIGVVKTLDIIFSSRRNIFTIVFFLIRSCNCIISII